MKAQPGGNENVRGGAVASAKELKLCKVVLELVEF